VLKSPSDVVKDLGALAKSRPEIIGFVDPLSPSHVTELAELAALLASHGHGQTIFSTASLRDTSTTAATNTTTTTATSATSGQRLSKDGDEENVGKSSAEAPATEGVGLALALGNTTSLRQLTSAAASAARSSRAVCLSAVTNGRLSASHAADLAVGLGAQLLHVGPLHGAGTVTLERLRRIASETGRR
jgi:hypothetical protein